MIKTVLMASAMTMALVGGAYAAGAAGTAADGTGQFYATPIQKGAPTDLPGERMVPGAVEAAGAVNLVVEPMLVPINQIGTGVGATVGGVIDPTPPAPAAAPVVVHHHHHHHFAHRHMMKKVMH